MIRTFRTFRPIVRQILGQRIIKRIHNCDESKITCDKIYHSEKYKKMNEKLQDIENRMINDNFSHKEEYKKIIEKLESINIEPGHFSLNTFLCLIILLFWKN
jgi:hypothetical protein